MGGCCSCCGGAQVGPIDELAISIFGIDNSGKTSFLRSLSGDFNFDTVPTVGLGQELFMFDDIKLKVYDLGGNSQFRNVWERFYAEIWGFIYVVDASDPDRFEESKATLTEMMKHKMINGKPVVVVANKQDKAGAVNAAGLKIRFQVGRIPFYDVVATYVDNEKCHDGITNAVQDLIGSIVKNYTKLVKRRTKDLEEQRQIDDAEQKEKMARLQRRREEMAAQRAEEPPPAPEPEAEPPRPEPEQPNESDVVVA
jgi:ADP-ribosylation factor-like protein 13B